MVVRDTKRTRNPLRLDVATVDGAGRAYVATQGPAAVDRKEYDALNDYEKRRMGPRAMGNDGWER